MRPRYSVAVLLGIGLLAVATVRAAKVKIEVQYDKTFDFKSLRTYRWHPQGAGDVKLLAVTGERPEDLRTLLEPVIVRSVEQNLAGRGIAKATTGTADLNVSYYVLMGPNINAQTMGQFMRPVPEWGLVPFAPATQSLEIYEQGTLILDIAAAQADHMIWRGSAKAEIDRRNSDKARDDRIRSAVQEMLKKFPPKP